MRRPGTGLENQIAEDLKLRKTSNSGAVFGDGDLRHPLAIIECKDESGDAIRFPASDLKKIKAQALKFRKPHWIRFFRNGHGEIVVSMDYKLAMSLLDPTAIVKCEKCGHEQLRR